MARGIRYMKNAGLKQKPIKCRIRQLSSKYGMQRAKIRNNQEEELEVKLKSLEGKQDKVLNIKQVKEVETKISLVKTKVEGIADHKTKGLILRSQASWHGKGEKSTKYFLQVESRNTVKKPRS